MKEGSEWGTKPGEDDGFGKNNTEHAKKDVYLENVDEDFVALHEVLEEGGIVCGDGIVEGLDEGGYALLEEDELRSVVLVLEGEQELLDARGPPVM